MAASTNKYNEWRFEMITAELRWFGQGPMPGVWSNWFKRTSEEGLDSKHSEQRTDCYLYDPKQTALSVKHRAGKTDLEVKGLLGDAGRLDMPPFQGIIELWAKWALRPLVLTPSIKVSKERWRRTFVVIAGVAVEAGSQGKDPRMDDDGSGEGCRFELTRLTLSDQTVWWTLGFEAFGTPDSLAANLRKVALYLADTPTPSLDETLCCGYPEWLSRLPCARTELE